MRYIGAFAVILAALLAWRAYSGFLCEELELSRAFLGALRDYRDKVSCYLLTPKEWARGYAERSVIISDFISCVAVGESMKAAYEAVKDSYCLPDEIDEALTDCFSALGEGYLDVELAILDSAIARIEDAAGRLSAGFKSKEQGVGALLGACAVGTVILII